MIRTAMIWLGLTLGSAALAQSPVEGESVRGGGDLSVEQLLSDIARDIRKLEVLRSSIVSYDDGNADSLGEDKTTAVQCVANYIEALNKAREQLMDNDDSEMPEPSQALLRAVEGQRQDAIEKGSKCAAAGDTKEGVVNFQVEAGVGYTEESLEGDSTDPMDLGFDPPAASPFQN